MLARLHGLAPIFQVQARPTVLARRARQLERHVGSQALQAGRLAGPQLPPGHAVHCLTFFFSTLIPSLLLKCPLHIHSWRSTALLHTSLPFSHFQPIFIPLTSRTPLRPSTSFPLPRVCIASIPPVAPLPSPSPSPSPPSTPPRAAPPTTTSSCVVLGTLEHLNRTLEQTARLLLSRPFLCPSPPPPLRTSP